MPAYCTAIAAAAAGLTAAASVPRIVKDARETTASTPARHSRPAAGQTAPFGDRSLQPALPLLHAGGRVSLAAAAGAAELRGTHRTGETVQRARGHRGAPDGRRAAAAARTAPPGGHAGDQYRHRRPGADHQ